MFKYFRTYFYNYRLLMSFYLVNQPLSSKIYLTHFKVVFSRIMHVQGNIKALVLISSKGTLRSYQLNSGQLLQQLALVYNLQGLNTIVNVQACDDLLIMMSFKHFYLVDLAQIIRQTKSQTLKKWEISKLLITKKTQDITAFYASRLNKVMKLFSNGQKVIIKMASRDKKEIIYSYGSLEQQKAQFSVQSQWLDDDFNYEYKVSLQSLANNCIIYQSYCNKGKPVKLHIVESISSAENKDQFLVTQLDVGHFYDQITVVDVALLNAEILCIFGNNSHEDTESSLMVVYNARQKCTLNYLNFKQATIQKIYWFQHKHYQFNYNNSLTQFDGVQIGRQQSKCFQLYPQSYETDQFMDLKGRVLSIDKNFIVSEEKGQIIVYPKIHKIAIYYEWMNMLGVHQVQSLAMIAQLLQ